MDCLVMKSIAKAGTFCLERLRNPRWKEMGNSLCTLQAQVSPCMIHSVFRASSRSCDPDEFNRELSRVFGFPMDGSYTFAHLNPIPRTVMQALIRNQII